MTNTRKSMPTAIAKSCGCKVAWSVYATIEEAKAAAAIAEHNARIDEAAGYDFGFSNPGEIRSVDAGFEVCHP